MKSYSTGLHDLFWGIRRENESINQAADVWSHVNFKMSGEFGSGKNKLWWPWWSWIDSNHEFDAGFRNWDKSAIPWVSMREGTLVEKIATLAIRVHNTLIDCHLSAPDKSTT